jgi:hypothetical protein
MSRLSELLSLARNHPTTDRGRAAFRTLLDLYGRAAEREMYAHHDHVAGRITDQEWQDSRVEPRLEDFANWVKRKVLCSTDPVGMLKQMLGSKDVVMPRRKKRKSERKREARAQKGWAAGYPCTQLSFEDWLALPGPAPVRTDRSLEEWRVALKQQNGITPAK